LREQSEECGMRIEYRRILLKLSGEALMGTDSYGINTDVLDFAALSIRKVCRIANNQDLNTEQRSQSRRSEL